MNCAECQELLVSYLEDLLDGSGRPSVAEHLKNCVACRAALEGLQALQQRLVGHGKVLAQSSVEDEVMNRIIREQSARVKSATQAGAALRLRRFLMKNPMTRVAAAAVVVIACVLAVSMWKGTTSITLAAVVAKVEQVQAYLYRERGTTQDQTRGDSTSEATVLMSNVYGAKTEQTTVDANGRETRILTYALPQQKNLVIVNVTERQYGRIRLDDKTWENMKIENRDPREMLRRLLACEHVELGTAVIDGVKAQGFETTDPTYLGDTDRNLSARVWVAVDTWLPVRYELELDVREGVHISTVQDGYQWGIQVVASDFEPDIPADFTAHEMDGMQMPSYSEQGFIEALQIAAEFTGRYPEKVDSEGVRRLSMDIATVITTGNSAAAEAWREKIKSAGSKEAAIRMGQERMMKLTSLATFNAILGGEGAKPVYHGDVVTPSDAELPLMRWRVSADEYRVIFGDLHVETVSADTLATLEAALPK